MLHGGSILLENGSILKVQPVRQRKIYSCIACHSKKIKCSKDRPTCERCAKIGLECHYYINERVSRKGNASSVSKSSKAKPKRKKQEINKEEPINNEEHEPLIEDVVSNEVVDEISNRIPSPPSNEQLPSPNESVQEGGTVDSPSPDQISSVSSIADHMSSTDQLETRHSASSTSGQMSSIDQPELQYISAKGYDSNVSKQRLLRLIIDSLPAKLFSDLLVKVYQDKIHFFIPLLDMEDFDSQYQYFWDYYIANQLKGNNDWVNGWFNNKLDFFLTYYIVLFGASINTITNNHEILHINHIIVEIFKYLKFPRFNHNYTLKYLQLFTVYHSLMPLPSIIDIATLIRTAQLFKLDKDPVIYHKLADAELVQFRRLLWWHIVYLDMRSSLLSNVQPTICLDKFDTSLPVEINHDKKLLIQIVVMNSKFRFCALLNEVLNSKHDNVRQKIMDLHVHCNGSILALKDFLSKNATTDKEFLNFVIDDLKLIPDKALLLLHRRCVQENHYIFPINTRSIPRQEIFFNYNDYNINTNNFNVIFLHLVTHFMDINKKFPQQVCISWSLESHLFIHMLLLLLFNLMSELKNMMQTSFVDDQDLSNLLLEFLRSDIKLGLLNQLQDFLTTQLQNKSPKLAFWQKSVVLINANLRLIKLYPLKFASDETQNPEEFINYNRLNTKDINSVSFIDPYEMASVLFSRNPAQRTAKNDTQSQLENDQRHHNQPQTTSCADIAPRSMTALAAATTVAKIGMFDSPVDPTDMVDQEPGTFFGNSYNNYDDDLPIIENDQQAKDLPQKQDETVQESAFDKEKRQVVSQTLHSLSYIDSTTVLDLELSNEYINTIVSELQKLLHFL